MLPREGQLLRIFLSETDRHEGAPLYEWIVARARKAELAGATVLRGMLGYGANSRLHTTKILRLSQDLPVVIEIVDVPEKIDAFIAAIEPSMREGLMTVERVNVRFYRGAGD